METLRDPIEAIGSSALQRSEIKEERVFFLDCHFDTGSLEKASCDILAEMHGPFKYVVTPNVYYLVRMFEDPATMRPQYEGAWRAFCDSRVLRRLARVSGLELPVVPGSDLTADLITRAARLGLTIAVVGPTHAACARLQEKYPGLVVLCHTPKMGFTKSELEIRKCVDFVVKAQAPLVFLAVGDPQQGILASRIAAHPRARGIGLCVGASIDFLTGVQRRAPVWVQKAGLEWAHRLLTNPRRFARRYLRDSIRIFYFFYLDWKKNMLMPQLRGTTGIELERRVRDEALVDLGGREGNSPTHSGAGY
jgi:N-acetylglucosaminyldiphosphoundecaprenol N-acetyl-beta-D-mannosaminyltransferase